MDDFDKEFDAAPEASFDDEFEKAESIEKPGKLKRFAQGAKQFAQGIAEDAKYMGEGMVELGKTLHDNALGAAQGMTWGGFDDLGGVVSTTGEYLADGIKNITPDSDRNKMLHLEAGNLPVDKLPGLTPELITKLKSQGKDKAEAIDMQEMEQDEIRKMYQKSSENEFKKAKERSPIGYTLSDIGMGMGTGVAAGKALGVFNATKGAKPLLDVAKDEGKLRAGLELLKRGGTSYRRAAPLLATEGVLRSEGNLIGEDLSSLDKILDNEVVGDVGSNLLYGIPAVLGLESATGVAGPALKSGAKKVGKKISDIAENSDYIQQLKIMKDYGEKGINPVSRKNAVKLKPGEEGLIRREDSRAKEIMEEIIDADGKLGKEIGDALKTADQTVKFNINPLIDDSFAKMNSNLPMLEKFAENPRLRKTLNKIADGSAVDLKPTEAKLLMDDLDSTIKSLGSFKAPPPEIEIGQKLLQDFRSKLDTEMRNQIKPYDIAKTRYHEFRQLVPETILSGETPRDISKVWMGDLKNPEKDLHNRIKGLTKYSTASGSANDPVKSAYENTIQGMHQWEAAELARGTKNPLKTSADEMATKIRDFSNDAAARRSATTTAEAKAFGTNLATAASGFGQSSRSMGLGVANLYGRMGSGVAKRGADWTRKVYNMPADKLNEAALRMQQIPGLKTIGKSLEEGLRDGNQAKKNAALFTAMQNPSAALFFDSEED